MHPASIWPWRAIRKRLALRGFLRSLAFALFVHAPEGRERLPDDLVHVVIAVGREASDEGDVLGRVGEGLVALEQLLIFRAWDRVIGIALGGWIFVGDRRHRRFL